MYRMHTEYTIMPYNSRMLYIQVELHTVLRRAGITSYIRVCDAIIVLLLLLIITIIIVIFFQKLVGKTHPNCLYTVSTSPSSCMYITDTFKSGQIYMNRPMCILTKRPKKDANRDFYPLGRGVPDCCVCVCVPSQAVCVFLFFLYHTWGCQHSL